MPRANNYFLVTEKGANQIDNVFPFDGSDEKSAYRAWNSAAELQRDLGGRARICVYRRPILAGPWSSSVLFVVGENHPSIDVSETERMARASPHPKPPASKPATVSYIGPPREPRLSTGPSARATSP